MKEFAVCTMLVLFAAVNSTIAVPAGVVVYEETVEVYDVLDGRLAGPPSAQWQHTYDTSGVSIESAALTIVAEGVDSDGEIDTVWFNGHYLGDLDHQGFTNHDNYNMNPGPGALGYPDTEITTTVFTLDPSWLGPSNDVSVSVGANWIVEIETSTLTVTQIPEPGTFLLLGLGCMLLRNCKCPARRDANEPRQRP